MVLILRTVISRVLHGAFARAAGLRRDNAESIERRADNGLAIIEIAGVKMEFFSQTVTP